MNSDNLEQIAKSVRASYFVERRLFNLRTRGTDLATQNRSVKQWDGGTDARGVTHTNIWLKIAKFALSNGVDVKLLIKAVFNEWKRLEPPLPTIFLTTKALDAVRVFQRFKSEEVANQIKAYKLEAAQELMFKKARSPDARDSDLWREIITSPSLTANALFRYCMACDTGQADLVEAYKKAAMMEYLQSPNEYDNTLSKFLLDEFKLDAQKLLDQLLNQEA